MSDYFFRVKKFIKFRKLAFFLNLFVFFHLGLLSLSQFDESVIGANFYKISKSFILPIFRQKWTMFAPDPLSYSLQIRYSCEKNGPWKIWDNEFKQMHSVIPSISFQKRIFYVDSYSVLLEKIFQSHDDYSNAFFSSQISYKLIQLLKKNCDNNVPSRAELVKISAILEKNQERYRLWGI